MTVLSQIADYGSFVSQYGFAGFALWMIVKRMDRMEHVVAGLSRALWFDIAARPSADKFIKEQARKIIAEMDEEK